MIIFRINRTKQILLFVIFLSYTNLYSQIEVDTTYTVKQLVEEVLFGDVISEMNISNIMFNGQDAEMFTVQTGKFTNGDSIVGLSDGIIITSGHATMAGDSNTVGNYGVSLFGVYFDSDLASIASGSINNAAVIEFDFAPTGNEFSFKYVFASEEYNEFVNSNFNDAFGLFFTDTSGTTTNIALAQDGAYVSINNINNSQNSSQYIDNAFNSDSLQILYPNFQFDGFTQVINASASVVIGELHHFKIAICDVSDGLYDSGVFLSGGDLMVTINENDKLFNKLRIYPNPFTDYITLNNPSNENVEIVVYNLLGKELMRSTIPVGKTQINLSHINENALIIKVFSNSGIETKKLLKVR